MAKVGLRTGILYRKRGMSGLKKVNVVVSVTRAEKRGDGIYKGHMQTGSRAFVACASFRQGGYVRIARGYEPSKLHGACGYGKNPRAAIATALRKAAAHVSKRSGSFAGLNGYSKTNRKARRMRRRAKRY